MNKVQGRRISAAEAYLTPDVRRRPNLRILPDTLVRRVILENRRARAVEVEGARGVERIEASTVILSGGALNTPGVLLRSGVGPDREVRRLAIEPVFDSPAVGRRLLDHPGTGLFVFARHKLRLDRSAPIVQTVLRYSSGLCDNRADVLLQPVSFCMVLKGLPMYALVAAIGKPRGHGTMRYPDADPRSSPVIESHFFEDAQDRAIARDALGRCFEFIRTKAISKMGFPLLPPFARGPGTLERLVPYFCDSGYHPCGTVPMGPTFGDRAAIDGRGKVYGVEGLYVVDASVMPTVPSSNIHVPTLMVAERMAEWLSA